jgi:hypothetical protein
MEINEWVRRYIAVSFADTNVEYIEVGRFRLSWRRESPDAEVARAVFVISPAVIDLIRDEDQAHTTGRTAWRKLRRDLGASEHAGSASPGSLATISIDTDFLRSAAACAA